MKKVRLQFNRVIRYDQVVEMTDEEYYALNSFYGTDVSLTNKAHRDMYYLIEDKVNLREFVADDEFEYLEVTEQNKEI